MKRKKIYGIFMLVAIAVFLFAGGRILQIYLNYQESQPTKEEHLCCKERQGTCVMIRQKNLAFAGVPKGLFICSICVNI